jgi:competence protein ComEC
MVDRDFPSPQSELLLGMLIGLDRLKEVPNFSENLRDTSTIHVVVVSGFNIALVFGLVTKVLGSEYKLRNILIAQLVTLFYALLSGFEPPVVRALVMGSIVAWGKYSGRLIDGLRVLLFAASVMVMISPSYLVNASFQLSFAASLGLILFSNIFSGIKVPEDLKSTFSAQLLVWPIISVYFGRVSMIGIVVNPLILWTVPVATVLGGAFLLLGFISPFLAKLFSVVIYPFLDVFCRVVTLFGNIKHISLDYKINAAVMATYYFIIISCVLFYRKVVQSKYAVKKD